MKPANGDLMQLATAKELKREQKRERDQVRLIDGWEQYRTLWDGIEFKRQLIKMGDGKVRFALAIMAALNAAVLILLTRGPVIQLIADGLGPWLAIPLVVYGFFTFAFLAHAIEALRPTPAEARRQDAHEWDSRELGDPRFRGDGRPVGLFIRGPLDRVSFEEERQLWTNARLSDVNAELILFNRSSSFVLTRQLGEIRKVYQRLKVLVILAALVVSVVVTASVVNGGVRMTKGSVSLR
jgi:hypothetical protein